MTPEEEYLQKYCALSTKVFPITLRFCEELNKAFEEEKTPEEIEREKRDIARFREMSKESLRKQLENEYMKGYQACREEYEKSDYVYFDVTMGPSQTLSFCIKKPVTLEKLKTYLKDYWQVSP